MSPLEHTRDERIRGNQPEPRDDAEPSAHPAQQPPLVSSLGNAAVQRLLRATHSEDEPPIVGDALASAIEGERGGGSALDGGDQQRFGAALGADLGDVRVHTGSEPDALNQAVQADAFTTGSDIFFREGEYRPGTAEGDELLAHELTHVVQQRSAPASGGGLQVSDPDDATERQAAAVAGELTTPGGGLDRQEEEEELMMSPSLDRQEEEEEMLQPSPSLDRQEEEEEMLQPSPTLDRSREDEPAADR